MRSVWLCILPRFEVSPQIWTGDPRPIILPRVLESSAMKLQLGYWVLLNLTRGKNVRLSVVRLVAFHACLSLGSDHSRCRWITHLKNHGKNKTKKKPHVGAPNHKEHKENDPDISYHHSKSVGSLRYFGLHTSEIILNSSFISDYFGNGSLNRLNHAAVILVFCCFQTNLPLWWWYLYNCANSTCRSEMTKWKAASCQ